MEHACDTLSSLHTKGIRSPSLIDLFRKPIRFFTELANSEGPVAKLKLGNRHFYLINDPAIIQDMLVTQGAQFEKFPQIDSSKGLFGEGLLTSEDPLHLRQRRLIQPIFNHDFIRRYAEETVASTERLAESWRDNTRIDGLVEMNKLTLDIITRTVFSMSGQQAANIASELDVILHMLNQIVMPWGELLLRLPLPSTRRYQRAIKQVDSTIYGFIEEELRSSDSRSTIVRFLLSSKDADTGERMSDRQIRDELITMFVAGHDTTANGLVWTLYLLASHPELQKQLASTVDEVLGGRAPTVDDYSRLNAVKNAFSESLRLYPPVWILGRRALQPYSFGGFEAQKGSILLICTAVLHRYAEHFPNPGEFCPDRWLAPSWPRYAYVPFGGGARLCIGERFAWMEGILCLTTLLQRFRFELIDTAPPEPLGLLTLRPKHGIPLRVVKR